MKMFNITTNSCVHNRMVTFISRKGDREILNEVMCFGYTVGDKNSQLQDKKCKKFSAATFKSH